MNNLGYQNDQNRGRGLAKFASLTRGLDLRGKRVLDVGCNRGLMCLLASRAGAYRVVGVDTDQEVLSLAAADRDREWPDDTVQFLRSSLADLELAPVDVVIATSVLHHCGDLDASMRKIRSLLAPGGVLAADVWPTPSYVSPYSGLEYRVPTMAGAAETVLAHFRAFTDLGDASAETRPGTRWVRALA